MVDPVSINQAANAYANATRIVDSTQESSGPGIVDEFANMVAGAVNGTVGSVTKAEGLSMGAALGNKSNLTDLVTAISSAELALSTIVNLRDRAISAYQEIIKMPI